MSFSKMLRRYETAHLNVGIAKDRLAEAESKLAAVEADLIASFPKLEPISLTYALNRVVVTIDSDGLTTKVAARKLS